MLEALTVQGRVLLALMLREARTRYGRKKAGYLWALIEPLIHIGLFIAIFSFLGRAAPLGDSAVMFLATGMAPFFAFRNVMGRTQGGYGSNEALLSFPVVKLMDVFLGRALLEVATGVTVMFVLIGGIILFASLPLPRSTLIMLSALALLFSIGFGWGLFLGIIAQFVPSLSSVLSVPMRLLYFVSGVFYLPDALPPYAREILAWNPILHGITLFRTGYYEMYESHMLDVRYLCGWAIGSILLAFVTERIARKPIRSIA